MADPNLPPDFNKQCLSCHQIINGPADGQNPGHKVKHISETGEYMQAEPDETHPFNVSHGYCDTCGPVEYDRFMADYQRKRAEREEQERAEREEQERERKAAARRQRRFRRGRKDQR